MKSSPLLDLYNQSVFVQKNFFGMDVAYGEGIILNDEVPFIMDLSAVPKVLVIGRGAKNWLQNFGEIPSELFACSFTENGGYICEIMANQYVIVSDPSGEDLKPIYTALPTEEENDVRVLPYECAEILLYGSSILEKISGLITFDTALLNNKSLTPVRIATVDVYALRSEKPSQYLRLICSPADAHFLTLTISQSFDHPSDLLVGFNPLIKL